MATETQKPQETGIQHDDLSSKTLDKAALAPLESRFEESSNPPTQSSSLEPPSAPTLEDPTTQEGEGNDLKKTESPDAEAPLGGSSTTGLPSDLEKKMRRAERFGMPMHLSEVEKRNSRAERFGTGTTTSHESDEIKKSEELKRKARAERFGLQAQTSTTHDDDDEEAKKKARSARFGGPVSKTDPADEQKKKARAIRFSQTASQANGNSNSVQKTSIVTETSGGA